MKDDYKVKHNYASEEERSKANDIEIMYHFSELVLHFANPRVREAALIVTDPNLNDPILKKIRSPRAKTIDADIVDSKYFRGLTWFEIAPSFKAVQALNKYCRTDDTARVDCLDEPCFDGLHQAIQGIIDIDAIRDIFDLWDAVRSDYHKSLYDTYAYDPIRYRTPDSLMTHTVIGLDNLSYHMTSDDKWWEEDEEHENTKEGTK